MLSNSKIRTALESGRLGIVSIVEIAIVIENEIRRYPERFERLIREIEQINKPIRQQVDDAIKELDV